MTGRGAGGPASGPEGPTTKSIARQEKALKALTAISGYQTGMQALIMAFGSEQAWVDRWLDDAHSSDNEIAAMERQFMRIIDAWQDAVFDVIEREAAAQGRGPRPASQPITDDEAQRWNQEAADLGLIGEPDPANRVPNRWERQVLLGFLQPADVDALKPLADARQVFTHRYTEADDAKHGRLIWKRIGELDALVPVIAGRAGDAIDVLWPQDAEA